MKIGQVTKDTDIYDIPEDRYCFAFFEKDEDYFENVYNIFGYSCNLDQFNIIIEE